MNCQNKKALAVILLIAITIVALSSCSSGSPLVGKWKLTTTESLYGSSSSYSMQLLEAFGGSITMSFGKTKCSMETSVLGKTQKVESTYSIKGDKLIMDGDEVAYSIDGKTLTLEMDGEKMVFIKQ